jgi:hypothetical protein
MAKASFNIHTTGDKDKAYRTVINVWLKASPENFDICRAIIKQNKYRQALLKDAFGGMAGCPKDLRLGLSLPHGLYYSFVGYERMHGREFMQEKDELVWFAKHFPQFVIAERI